MFFLRNLWLFFLDFLETIVVSLAIFAIVYIFLFQPHQVDGRSMEPNFHNAEYILTDKISYRLHAPKRGDVVVFHSPQDERVDFIKRIIGTPGDTILLKGGYVYLNGTQLKEDYINDPGQVLPGRFMRDNLEVDVPPGQYLVMGDNRLHSSDSREWGLITTSDIVGRAFFRYWPVPVFGVIPTAESELTVGAVKGAISAGASK
ncbi:MAG: signal peptidase I [Microgenomates group bacterium]